MGDSDDEYDRRRRDKFRRERSDYDRSREREERRRDDWSDREWDRGRERRSRGEYRDYDRSRRERFSPPRHEMSPPQKRMRRDWDDHTSDPYHSGYDMQYAGSAGAPSYGPPQPWGHPDMHVMQHHGIPIQARLGNLLDVDLGTPAPVMKSFKEFLLSLEDSVDETEAVRRYNEYKMEFRRQQMQDFFLAHKDEEWFRSKYHPDEVGRHRQESQAALRNRLNAYMYLMDNSWLNDILLDMEKAPAIIKLLDAGVIKMEGGTEIDMKILDEEEEQAKREAAKKEAAKKEEARATEGQTKPPEEKEATPKTDPEKEPEEKEKPPKPEKEEEKKEEEEEKKEEEKKVEKKVEEAEEDSRKINRVEERESRKVNRVEEPERESRKVNRVEEPERESRKVNRVEEPERESRKVNRVEEPERESRKVNRVEEPERESRKVNRVEEPERESRKVNRVEEPERESRKVNRVEEPERESRKVNRVEEPERESRKVNRVEEPERESRKSSKRKRKRSCDSDDGSDSESASGSEHGSPKSETQGQNGRDGSPKKEEEEDKQKEKPKEEPVKPRPLHKTCSLFIRNVAPNISKAEITALCKRYPGFLRVALSDPQPERRFLRKGYVTFDRGVNIKEICWNLQNIRLRECELSPVVNRELSWRIRHVSGITQHRPILRNDIKLAARLIHALDERGQLWKEMQDGEEVAAQNPILKNITDYLIDEVSAEEEDLLSGAGRTPGAEPPKEGNPTEISVERDDKLIKVLDKLLLYLRVVHSVDYYINCDYPSEDEMPTRCGIMHVRGPIPPNRVSHREVAEWQKTFEEKLVPLFAVRETLSEEEAQKVGKKDPEQEVEKFVTANTQELGKEKWLCPLSGKKFKGPEFVRKHIFNKHAEKIEEVKKEVVFFNNFLMDSKRPALPEVKPIQSPMVGQGLAPGLLYPHQGPQALLPYGQPRPPVLGYGGAPQFPPSPYGVGRGYDAFRGQGGVYPGKPRNRMMRGDPRSIIEYRDLDAPEDVDFF